MARTLREQEQKINDEMDSVAMRPSKNFNGALANF